MTREQFVEQVGREQAHLRRFLTALCCGNGAEADDISWVVPHEANLRIIEAVAKRAELSLDKVAVNIEHYGNTSAATIPLALWDFESKLKKGDNIIFTAFGAGFVHGASYFKWAYDGNAVASK